MTDNDYFFIYLVKIRSRQLILSYFALSKLLQFQIYLIGLALCDSFTCLGMITMRGFPSFGDNDVSAFGFTISWVMIPITSIIWTGGMFITDLLSCELYLIVCHQKKISSKMEYQAMGVIGVLSTVINLPVFWFVNNLDLTCNLTLRLIFVSIPSLVFRFIAPMLALTIFSCLTIRKVNLLYFGNQTWWGH